MMLGKYFKKTVFRKEHTADGGGAGGAAGDFEEV